MHHLSTSQKRFRGDKSELGHNGHITAPRGYATLEIRLHASKLNARERFSTTGLVVSSHVAVIFEEKSHPYDQKISNEDV